jgi:hypothetical protein
MAERIERCETCKYWEIWDAREPLKVTLKDWYEEHVGELDEDGVKANEAFLNKEIDNDDRIGTCKRRCPQIVEDDGSDDVSRGKWPWTTTADWCGEWTPANADVKQQSQTPFPWDRVSTRCRNYLHRGVNRDVSGVFRNKKWPLTCEDLIEVGRDYALESRNWGNRCADEVALILKELGFGEWK